MNEAKKEMKKKRIKLFTVKNHSAFVVIKLKKNQN